MEWTDESIARLRELWQEGLSTAEIGRRMQITKNAVVGKAHRLDLSARPSPIRKTELQAGTAQPKRPLAEKPRVASVTALPPSSPPTPVMAEPVSPPVVVETPAVVDPIDRMLDRAEEMVALAEPVAVEPEAEALPDNVHLLRPEQALPVVARDHEPVVVQRTVEPSPVRRVAEPREPRRRGLSCCWPLGEPGTKGFHFCGADPTPGKPYCAEHASLAYVKLRDRRDSVA